MRSLIYVGDEGEASKRGLKTECVVGRSETLTGGNLDVAEVLKRKP